MARPLQVASPPASSHSPAHYGLTVPWDPLWGWEKAGILWFEQSLRGKMGPASLWTCISAAKGEVIKGDGFGPAKEKWMGESYSFCSLDQFPALSFWLLLLLSIHLLPRSGLSVLIYHCVTLPEQTHLVCQMWLHSPCGRKHISGFWHPFGEVKQKFWFKKENRWCFRHVLCSFSAFH